MCGVCAADCSRITCGVEKTQPTPCVVAFCPGETVVLNVAFDVRQPSQFPQF